MEHPMVGLKIREIRVQTKAEMEYEGWDMPATVIVLEDGTLIYPSQDEEGNNAGALFGMKNGEGFRLA